MDPELARRIKEFPRGTGLMMYRYRGKILFWAVGVCPEKDSEQTLRDHLARYNPEAEFLGCAIK
jgi:hypothetical protein